MPHVFGQSLATFLVVTHALFGVVLAGSAGHLLVSGIVRLRSPGLPRPMGRHARLALGAWAMTVGLGLLAYPRYRYFVRGLVLDAKAPWASNVFDLKENLAVFALPVLLGLFFLDREAPVSDEHHRLTAVLGIVGGLLVLSSLVGGFIVSAAGSGL
jgi:hypothetical protein